MSLAWPVILALLAAAPASAAALDWTIRDFEVRIRVENGGWLSIQERIEVLFGSPQHGIYRDIPLREQGPGGFAHGLRFELQAVVDNAGHVLPTRVRHGGGQVKIRIGDPDRTVTGPHVYFLRYRIRGGVDFHPDHDELYWNVTGNQWPVSIEAARAQIELPAAISESDVSYSVYTGERGARGHGAEARYTPGLLEVVTTDTLPAWSGLTLALGWPKGIVQPPSLAARVIEFLRWNGALLLPIPVGIWMWRRWRARGRDPRIGRTVSVQYEPPPGLGPAEVGTLIDERVDLRDLTAAVVHLAIRGHLRIESSEAKFLGLFPRHEFAFVRQPPPESAAPLAPHEAELLAGLFERGDRVQMNDLRQRFYRHLPAIRRGIYDALVRARLFEASPESVRNRWIAIGIAWLVVGTLLVVGWSQRQATSPIAPLIGCVLSGGIFLVAARAMPRRTRRGVELTLWARGLEEFIERVESHRLELEQRARLDPRAQFEKVLPFAMALGVATRWADAFEGIYTTPPKWYVGPVGHGFASRPFVAGLESMRGSLAESMASAPRSSGGSGLGSGGFSGGGHGGGGGGAW